MNVGPGVVYGLMAGHGSERMASALRVGVRQRAPVTVNGSDRLSQSAKAAAVMSRDGLGWVDLPGSLSRLCQ